MADAVSECAPAAPQEEAALVARRRAEERVPRHRFGIAYLALAAVLGAAVGLFVVLAGNGGKDQGQAWSTWRPTETGVQGRTEIAQHVESHYALESGKPIVVAYSTPLLVPLQGQLANVRAVAITTGLPGETANDAQIVDASNFWAYQLCGLGKNCALSEGKPSEARGRLLQREALELALYTFKYERAIDNVIAFFPPGAGGDPGAVLLRRSDLSSALDVPLANTLLPPGAPLVPGTLRARDLAAVRRYITNAYTYSSATLQDGSPILVLKPPSG